MQNAYRSDFEMLALMPLSATKADLACEEVRRSPSRASASEGRWVCEVANDNSPSQVVISGTPKAVQAVAELAKK